MSRRLFQVVLGSSLGLALALILAPLLPMRGGEAPASGAEFLLPAPLPAPGFALTSHTGEAVDAASLRGRHAVVFFGYTSCPDVCPLTLASLAAALERLGEAATDVQVVLVTVDPARDTPERMAAYLEGFDPSFLGLTGTEEQVRAAAASFGVFFEVPPGDGAGGSDDGEGHGPHHDAAAHAAEAGYVVDHTARIFVLAPDGRIPMTFPPMSGTGDLARGLGHLLDAGRVRE